MKIAHISDIHVTASFFVKEWGEALIEKIKQENPDIALITGDITDNGYAYEYEISKAFIDRIPVEKKLIIPGNHDARNGGYVLFEDMFTTRYPKYEDDNIIILGIDSSEPDIDDGHIGRANYAYIKEQIKSKDKLKIVGLHHHLIPIPGTGRERNIPVDTGDFLKLLVEENVDFILSGHKHLPWVWKLGDMHFVTAGTAATKKLKGRSYPSFNVMTIDDRITVREIQVDEKGERIIMEIDNRRKNA